MKKLVYSLQFTVYSLILLFSVTISFTEAFAGEKIPYPPQAEKIKEEEVLVNNSSFKTSVYRSDWQAKKILDFYKVRLPACGWKLVFDADQQGTIVANFSQGDRYINIMIQEIQDSSFVTITEGKQSGKTQSGVYNQEKSSCPECEKSKKALSQQGTLGAVREDAPGKDLKFVPRYPEAIRAASVEREQQGKVDLAYYSSDKPDDILDYYWERMPDYNWSFIDEVDLDEVSKQFPQASAGLNLSGSSLIFEGPDGQCIVSVIKDPKEPTHTLIGVRYREK